MIQRRFGDTGEAGDDERGYHTLENEVLWHKLRVLQVIHVGQVLMKDRVHQSKKSNVF